MLCICCGIYGERRCFGSCRRDGNGALPWSHRRYFVSCQLCFIAVEYECERSCPLFGVYALRGAGTNHFGDHRFSGDTGVGADWRITVGSDCDPDDSIGKKGWKRQKCAGTVAAACGRRQRRSDGEDL